MENAETSPWYGTGLVSSATLAGRLAGVANTGGFGGLMTLCEGMGRKLHGDSYTVRSGQVYLFSAVVASTSPRCSQQLRIT